MPELLIHLVSCGQRRGMGGGFEGKPEAHFFLVLQGERGEVRRGLNILTQYLNSSKYEGKGTFSGGIRMYRLAQLG